MMQLSLELDRQGHDVTAVYKANPDMDEDFLPYEKSGVTLKRIGLKDTKLRFGSLSDIKKIRTIIKDGSFDIIHSHSNAVDHAFLSTLGIDIPIIANRGMCSALKLKNALKYKSNKISHVIAVSENVKQVMHETGGIPEDKVSVIYGSVDVNRFHPELKSEVSLSQLGIDDNRFIVGYTGSIGGRKGIDYFIEAFRRVVKNHPNAMLLLVGIHERQLRHHGIMIEPELSSHIKCLGFQHYPERYMTLFDLFVFPGTKSEGLTGAIREAAAMKIPVVTTDVGGNKELIRNNLAGIVVQPKDSVALSDGILTSIHHYERAKQMAEIAYQFVHENMTLRTRTRDVVSLYRRYSGRVDSVNPMYSKS